MDRLVFELTAYIIISILIIMVNPTYSSGVYRPAGSVILTVAQTWMINFSEGYENLTYVTLSVYPPCNMSEYQTVLSYDSNYEYSLEKDEFGNNMFVFNITDNIPQQLNISIFTKLKINYSAVVLDHRQEYVKVEYPFESNLTKYSEQMQRKALELTGNDQTMTEKIVSLTNWAYNNIKYDGFYEGTNEPAIAVYDRKRGTCDEYSVLLSSLARSIGIPMRIVYGFVYSESQGWQRHAWTEYYDENKWYPVDPTFLQILNLDPYHIKLAHSPDPSYFAEKITINGYKLPEYSTESYYDIRIVEVQQCIPTVSIDSTIEYTDDVVYMNIFLNNSNHYITETFAISYPEEIDMLGGYKMFVKYLEPNEETVIRIGFTKPVVEPGYMYSFPYSISARCTVHSSQFSLNSGQNFYYNAEEAKEFDRFVTMLTNLDKRVYLTLSVFIILILTSIHLKRRKQSQAK